jgi:hypothetical protein
MPMMIRGGNNQKLVDVSDEHRLLVDAVSFAGIEHVSEVEEQGYYLASDFIDLTTTTSFNGVFYVKNNSDTELHIFNFRTCGTVTQQWKLIKNPTAGTLISDANPGTNENLNFKSTNTLTADVYGASGNAKTVTNGKQTAQLINNAGHSIHELQGSIILGKGNSLAMTCKPGAAGIVCVSLLCYLEE